MPYAQTVHSYLTILLEHPTQNAGRLKNDISNYLGFDKAKEVSNKKPNSMLKPDNLAYLGNMIESTITTPIKNKKRDGESEEEYADNRLKLIKWPD